MPNIKIQLPNAATINWVTEAGPLVLSETSGTSPTPTPPPGGPPPNVPGYLIPYQWPDRQTRPTVPSANTQTGIRMSTRVPLNVPVKPNNLGFIRVAEVPGTNMLHRRVQVWINGVVAFDTGENGDTGPQLLFTVGNPNNWRQVGANFNAQPGDYFDSVVYSYDWQPGQNAAFLFDFAVPSRY